MEEDIEEEIEEEIEKEIEKEIEEYKDIYLMYLEEQTEKSDTHIHTSILYCDFKIWFAEKFNNDDVPSSKGFCAGLRKHIKIQHVRMRDKTNITIGIKFLQLKS